ncbi:sigma-70 family RNA polymerase sigma factor [Streptomyces sp. B-S-A8]|uniref:Sigma-70 family RNA polymerase sigma factor n=1 Tax=Streptomyces solicavernae TaxID=3043614 RepID=A0ABT6RT16_9ACTN|nr:sigma-70 family RNA polymerase sigma factor [Streptomyces sp. B-S-A8]MDI3386816.1 sigma-70 family RNA polymerase sigma factor [Streptomyces sp. B-S-A8]
MATLRPLLTAEAAAEAPAIGVDPGDLEQAVWLRLLEHIGRIGPPADPEGWLRDAVHAEVCRAEWGALRERAYRGEPATPADNWPEQFLLRAERHRLLWNAVRRLPRSCAGLLSAVLSPRDLTYGEIATELGISQGSVGPERARCLERLRQVLAAAECEGE